MSSAFCVAMPIMVLISRFGKDKFGNGRWLTLHKACAFFSACAIIGGWIIAQSNSKGLKSKVRGCIT